MSNDRSREVVRSLDGLLEGCLSDDFEQLLDNGDVVREAVIAARDLIAELSEDDKCQIGS